MSDELLKMRDNYSKEDFENTDFTPPDEGEHLMVIEKIKAEEHDFEGYTGVQAVLTLCVIEDKGNKGRKCFDRINLPHTMEKDGNRKRRALILSRLGFVTRGEEGAFEFDLARLEGVKCIVTIKHNQGKDKNGAERTYANVTFDGYAKADGDAGPDPADDFGDL